MSLESPTTLATLVAGPTSNCSRVFWSTCATSSRRRASTGRALLRRSSESGGSVYAPPASAFRVMASCTASPALGGIDGVVGGGGPPPRAPLRGAVLDVPAEILEHRGRVGRLGSHRLARRWGRQRPAPASALAPRLGGLLVRGGLRRRQQRSQHPQQPCHPPSHRGDGGPRADPQAEE